LHGEPTKIWSDIIKVTFGGWKPSQIIFLSPKSQVGGNSLKTAKLNSDLLARNQQTSTYTMKNQNSPLIRLACLLALAAAPLSTHAKGLIVSDGLIGDLFGWSVSQSGDIGLVGAWAVDFGAATTQGSAYVFRDLDTQSVKLTASDGGANDQLGYSVSLSGSTGLVGAVKFGTGAAYVFRDLDTATGVVTQNVKLTASDLHFDPSANFGRSVSLSGSIGLVGAYRNTIGLNDLQGSAYVFRDLDTATGVVTENVKLTASDAAAGDQLGQSVSQSGSIGLVGAFRDTIGLNDLQGSAYVFRNLDTATGAVTENVKLTASDGGAGDQFGWSVSLSGSVGLVGVLEGKIGAKGSAYVFRNLGAANNAITESAKLIASDGAVEDLFGYSVSLSGGIGLVGAYDDDILNNNNQGSAYVFRNLDTAAGAVTESVKLTASDGATNDNFGYSVSVDGDNFIIGAYGKDRFTGKAYSGSVESITTLDAGNASRMIDGISFNSQIDWIVGETTDTNEVTLNVNNTADVTAAGKAVYIGKNAGSDNNTLIVNGSLTANAIYVGAAGNTGNNLILGPNASVLGNIFYAAGTTVDSSVRMISGDLSLAAGSKFIFSLFNTLIVTGDVSFHSPFGIDDLIGLDSTVALGSYNLIDGTATDFATLGLENWGADNAYDLGGGKSAYFTQGSLLVEVIPEPSTVALLGFGGSALFLQRRRKLG